MTGEIVNVLGFIAGSVWVTAACWLRLVKLDPVEWEYAAALFLIGMSIILGSSELVLSGRPGVIQVLGVLANVVFLVLGVAVWWWASRHEEEICRHPSGR